MGVGLAKQAAVAGSSRSLASKRGFADRSTPGRVTIPPPGSRAGRGSIVAKLPLSDLYQSGCPSSNANRLGQHRRGRYQPPLPQQSNREGHGWAAQERSGAGSDGPASSTRPADVCDGDAAAPPGRSSPGRGADVNHCESRSFDSIQSAQRAFICPSGWPSTGTRMFAGMGNAQSRKSMPCAVKKVR